MSASITTKKAATIQNKIVVLSSIRDAKDIMFGAFSDKLTKEDKVREWKKITNVAQSLGLVAEDKNFSYIRDTFYPNLKRATVLKTDNAKKTGTGGGKDWKFTDTDKIILDIIGKESPALQGLGTKDSLGTEETHLSFTENDVDDVTEIIQEEPPVKAQASTASNSEPTPSSQKRGRRWITEHTSAHKQYEEEHTTKKQKLDLQVDYLQLQKENLQLQNYKLRLDLMEQEMRLGITPSKFTEHLHADFLKNNIVLSDNNCLNNN